MTPLISRTTVQETLARRVRTVRPIRVTEAALDAHKDHVGRALPVNVDGAIAAICARISGWRTSHAIFVISRLPNLIAHTRKERTRAVADTADRSEGSRRQQRGRLARGLEIGKNWRSIQNPGA